MARTLARRADVIGPIAEAFREHGYEGATLSLISKATGLGKGSLYHFFPGGKEEMAKAVLIEVEAWFEAQIFARLETGESGAAEIGRMFDAVAEYFRSGRRVCLVGAFALSDSRDHFAVALRAYFDRWIAALKQALIRAGRDEAAAAALAEEAVAGVQGAIVLARALDDPAVFARCMARLKARLEPRPSA
ncbi:MAG: TetR/AcrR family transcriptional regulator [Beijerinckiaceae bacterium]